MDYTCRQPLTNATIRSFAAKQKVTPAIVVGRLQYDGHMLFGDGNYLR